jgi:hypothetical protein
MRFNTNFFPLNNITKVGDNFYFPPHFFQHKIKGGDLKYFKWGGNNVKKRGK